MEPDAVQVRPAHRDTAGPAVADLGPVSQWSQGDLESVAGAGQVRSQLAGAVGSLPGVHLGHRGRHLRPGEGQRLTHLVLRQRHIGQRCTHRLA